jgi:hypothetical protein
VDEHAADDPVGALAVLVDLLPALLEAVQQLRDRFEPGRRPCTYGASRAVSPTDDQARSE